MQSNFSDHDDFNIGNGKEQIMAENDRTVMFILLFTLLFGILPFCFQPIMSVMREYTEDQGRSYTFAHLFTQRALTQAVTQAQDRTRAKQCYLPHHSATHLYLNVFFIGLQIAVYLKSLWVLQ